MAQTYDLTKGKVTPLILKFFFPMFFTNMLQQIYIIADIAIVGKGLGDNALAAVGNMSSLNLLVIGFSMGLANGFSVSIAQKFGAKDYSNLRSSIASSVVLSAFITIIITALSTLFLPEFFTLIQTDQSIMKDSLKYGYIIFGGLAATMAYNICSSILRALGDSKTPFIAIIISTVINIILDSVFIFVLNTGVEGAAAATIISQILSAFVCLIRLRKIDVIKLEAQDFKNNSNMYKELLKNGLPMALMNSITALGCMVVQYFVNGLGVAYTSAYSACSKYINLFIQPSCTAGFAMSSFTSQNYGAGKYRRIQKGLKVCLSIAFISYLIIGSVMCFFPEALAKIMLTGEEPIALTMKYLPICGIAFLLVNFLFIFRSAVQGLGKPIIPMISGIIEMLMRIAVIVLFIDRFGYKATAYADVVAWIGAVSLNFTAYIVIINKYLKGSSNHKIRSSHKIASSKN
ncbi:MAG: MATE family efflux transporter [Ruminococcus sp.]|nr:MATE family efflux transporter [Ruminococcus sp.]